MIPSTHLQVESRFYLTVALYAHYKQAEDVELESVIALNLLISEIATYDFFLSGHLCGYFWLITKCSPSLSYEDLEGERRKVPEYLSPCYLLLLDT
jgi:hypothetical protein